MCELTAHIQLDFLALLCASSWRCHEMSLNYSCKIGFVFRDVNSSRGQVSDYRIGDQEHDRREIIQAEYILWNVWA
jgi:hypothetical protein